MPKNRIVLPRVFICGINVFFNGSNNFTAGRQHQINGNNNVAGGISNNIAYSYAAAFGGYNVIRAFFYILY